MTARKMKAEQDAIRWAAANTDFVLSLAKEISSNLFKYLSDEFKTVANDSSMEFYVWYRKLGMIPQQVIQRFEQTHGLTEDVIRRLLEQHHLEDVLQSVSINDVVEKWKVRELEKCLTKMKIDYEREKERNDYLQARIIGGQ